MAKQFSTILVPVDFSINTEVAVSRAMELVHDDTSCIHLLHVQRFTTANLFQYFNRLLKGYTRQQVNAGMKQCHHKLERIKASILERNDRLQVVTWVVAGEAVEKAIIQKAARINADLIIIGKHSHSRFSFLNIVVPSRLAHLAGIPVLTAKPGCLNQEIKTVVIPVNMHYPSAKLKMLEALRNEAMRIRLVVFPDNEHDSQSTKQSLLNTFRALKIQSSNPVSYEILNGHNKARSLLNYCNKVNADILIVHPGPETRIGVWMNSHISDILPTDSRMQVLAVKPNL